MTVSPEDRRTMELLARLLASVEQDDPGTVDQRRPLLELVNARRRADGRPPLADEDKSRPEEGIYRRARALGMARTDR